VTKEQDTDRMAGELLNLLKGSLGKPSSAPGLGWPQAQADDNSALDIIKNILKQNIPSGPKPREQAAASTTQQGAVAPTQYAPLGQEVQVGGWEGLFRRQGQEREAMHVRHERERAEMHQRHVQEMESAMGAGGGGTVVSSQRPRRTASTLGPTRVPTTRRRAGLT
jgi:hypothetical protein